MARARDYDNVPLAGALWSLRHAASAWAAAVAEVRTTPISLHHPDRGLLTLNDIVEENAHDAHHHVWDIDRIERGTP
jgi:hypothetical protein